MAEVNWSKPVTLWRGREPGRRRDETDVRVAAGPLAYVVSLAVALDPMERRCLLITGDSDKDALDWFEILELELRDDFPFNI